MSANAVASVAPAVRQVRAYFAPVDRAAGVPTLFDPAKDGGFQLDSPPPPWVDLGWITAFARSCTTKVSPLLAGAPAIAVAQVRAEVEATVALEFQTWGKLQLALASGSQQTNLLATAVSAAAGGSGGTAEASFPLLTGSGTSSTAMSLYVGSTVAAVFQAGDLLALDVDYVGQLGYVGAGASGAYVRSAAAVGSDVNYVRRVTLNVGLVVGISAGSLLLERALLAGAPGPGMCVSKLMGFCDREGASFFQEWSALFVLPGEQGDRLLFHYPRLQAMKGSTEALTPLAASLKAVGLPGVFRALPVIDSNDGETVVCFRSYLPAAMRQI